MNLVGLVITGMAMVQGGLAIGATAKVDKPNIIFILADDMGIGDVSYTNPASKIKTPNIDQIAEKGISFTDAHTASTVCTPSRYSLLTGRYSWRSRMKRGVLGGYSSALIEPQRQTVASMLQGNGYTTACIGKWHLGMNMQTTDGKKASQKKGETTCNVDWNKPVRQTPTSNGFDYFYGIAGSLDMPPYIYIENDRFQGSCTEVKAFHRPGPAHKDFEAEDVLPHLTGKAVGYIEQHSSDKPFFMYFSLTAPHNPRTPAKQFRGKTGMGAYADLCVQVDYHVGEIVDALKKKGIEDNTLLLFSSDNGCENLAYEMVKKYKHYPSGPYRGVKRDNWEGGHRVPFIMQWPGKISRNRISHQTVSLVDFMATVADITGSTITQGNGEDSYSLKSILFDDSFATPLRDTTIYHSLAGRFAIRKGDWVLLEETGNDRGNEPEWFKKQRGYELTTYSNGELYNLKEDISQKNNLIKKKPEIAKAMYEELSRIKKSKRTAPSK